MRQSEYLGRKAIAAIKQAPRTAAALNRPLNVFATLSVTQTLCPKEEISSRFALLRDRSFYRWSTYIPAGGTGPQNGAPTFAWVIEAPKDGDDIHWLMHIRPDRFEEFEQKLPKWVGRWFGIAPWAERPVDIVRERHPTNRSKYMVKGASPAYGAFYYIPEDKLIAQGLVYGKRGGVSQNLGTSSRERLKETGLIVPRRSHRRYQPYPKVTGATGAITSPKTGFG